MATRPQPKATPSTDRRVLRTRQALRDALLALLLERGWDAIDVQALCERANVGRSTFYLHFPNKEALLEGGFGDLRTALRSQARGVAGGQTNGAAEQLTFVGGLIEHVHQQQHVFRALLGRRSGQYVQDRFREMLVEMVQEERSPGAARTWQGHAVSNFLGGALFQLLHWWLSAVRPQRPDEIEALFHALSKPVLGSSSFGHDHAEDPRAALPRGR